MSALPEEVKQAWENRQGPAIMTTVSKDSIPNSIYIGAVWLLEDKWVVADNYFDKTRANIKSGSKGAILFITKERKSYQIKGTIEYHESGEVFDYMKKCNSETHPGLAAAAVCAEEIYSGSQKLL